MTLAFDLISDLHVESWSNFDWTGQATSPICVVAGDVAKDYTVLEETLRHLSHCYQAVFYIDGNDEHKYNWDNIPQNQSTIADICDNIPGVTYLHDHAAIIQGVAFVGTNGWWNWRFEPTVDQYQSQLWFRDRYQTNTHIPFLIERLADIDANYLADSIQRLQTVSDAKRIVVVTHTLPSAKFVNHDLELTDTYRMNVMGNTYLMDALNSDTENKISNWVFGHYHGNVNQLHKGIQFNNNCRGRGDSDWKQTVYHPLRIEVDIS
jgi:hypothetical protein